MSDPIYKVEILDSNRNPITRAQRLMEINKDGHIIRYSRHLSDSGWAKIRLGVDDPMFDTFGNILVTNNNGLRIWRGNKMVWQGLITKKPHQRTNYIDVFAETYLQRTKKILAKRDPEITPGDGLNNYRTFKTGTMSAAITTLIADAKAAATANDPIQLITLGTIENPNFPPYFATVAGAALGGPWTFSADVTVQVDYKSVFYLINLFGAYSNCDFELTDNYVFNFKKMIGIRRPELVFEYNEANAYGTIDDFDVPENGSDLANDLWGLVIDNEGKFLHVNKRDEESINQYLLNQEVAAYSDSKDANSLTTRLNETLRYSAKPDSVINTVLNSKAVPFGQYDVGDTATFKIKRGIIQVNEERRITGATISVHNTGREVVALETNRLREDQL